MRKEGRRRKKEWEEGRGRKRGGDEGVGRRCRMGEERKEEDE
jgi:hypothetical protein